MNYIPKMFALPPKLVAISYMCGAIYAYINMHDLCCAFAVTYEGGERGLLIFFQLFTTFNFFFHLPLLPSQGSQQATYVMAWTGPLYGLLEPPMSFLQLSKQRLCLINCILSYCEPRSDPIPWRNRRPGEPLRVSVEGEGRSLLGLIFTCFTMWHWTHFHKAFRMTIKAPITK